MFQGDLKEFREVEVVSSCKKDGNSDLGELSFIEDKNSTQAASSSYRP